MDNRYFPSRKNGCFFSALANLLVELGDRPTAEKVFESYQHPLKDSLGQLPEITTRLVEDLTGGKYEGTLLTARNKEKFDKKIKKRYKEKSDEIIRIIREGTKKHRIETFYRWIFSLDLYFPPAIIFIQEKEHFYSKDETCHAIVDTGNKKIIDNGVVKPYRFKKLEKKIVAVLYVRKVEPLQIYTVAGQNQELQRVP